MVYIYSVYGPNIYNGFSFFAIFSLLLEYFFYFSIHGTFFTINHDDDKTKQKKET